MKKQIFLFILFLYTSYLNAGTKFYRASYRDDPTTTIVIGWSDDGPSNNAKIYYGTQDNGTNWQSYPLNRGVDRTVNHRGLNNRFARLTNLTPNTVYYFVIKDDNSVSQRMSFKTLPDDPNIPVMFINGGDTRTGASGFEFETNLCVPRRRVGFDLVAKIRPDFIAFSGDFIFSEDFLSGANNLWKSWFEDFQRVIGPESTKKRIPAIVPVYGNHEDNNDLYNLFDIPNNSNYYAFSSGRLFRFYCLNTDLECDQTQLNWFTNDLTNYTNNSNEPYWKFIQYHIPLAPHGEYSVLPSLINCWATLFAPHNIRLSMDGHTHVMKITNPISPSSGSGSEAGYILDNQNGCVYIGEGSWGAPMRNLYTNANGKAYSWTKAQGKFAGFNIVTVYKQKYEIRAVKFDETNVSSITQITESDPPASLPQNLTYWNIDGSNVYTLFNNRFVFSDDATLSQLNTSIGTLTPSFNPQNLNYTVSLPAGTTTIPQVIAVTNHPGASLQIINATNLNGTQQQRTTQVVVTAENLTTTRTYNVTFEVANFADARLASLNINIGELEPNFNPDHFNYSGILPPQTSQISQVSATPIDPQASVTINQATSIEGLATIIVQAADGLTTNTYTVNFIKAADDTKMITSFNINGQIGETEINQNLKTIKVKMPLNTNLTNLTPIITYIGSNLSPPSGQAQNFTNPVQYTVTAYNNTSVVYTASVELVENLSDNAYLASLTVSSGTLNPQFNPNTFVYNVSLEPSVTSVVVTANPQEPNATVNIYPYTNLNGSLSQRTTTVVVVAPNNINSQIYSVIFTYQNSSINKISQATFSEVYPNPAKDIIKVKFKNNTENCKILIHNGFGYIVEVKELNASVNETEFNIENLPQGTYFILINYSNSKSDLHKIIKQ